MADDNIEEDPFYVSSWYDHARVCINSGKNKDFCKKMSEYIAITNAIVEKEIKEYALKRQGHFDKQKMLEDQGKIYIPEYPE